MYGPCDRRRHEIFWIELDNVLLILMVGPGVQGDFNVTFLVHDKNRVGRVELSMPSFKDFMSSGGPLK